MLVMHHIARASVRLAEPADRENDESFLAGEIPLHLVVVAHALNEHLIVKMLREIDRLETLHNSLSDSKTSRKYRRRKRGTHAAHAFICQCSMDGLALVHDSRCPTAERVSV